MWVFIPDFNFRNTPPGFFPPTTPPGFGFPAPFPGTGTGFPSTGLPFPGAGFPTPGMPFPGTGPTFPPGGGITPGQQSPGSQQVPATPPPAYKPAKPAAGTYALDPGSISGCLFKFTYIWQSNGDEYWMFLIFVGPTSISGFRWFPVLGWRQFSIDLRLVNASVCV